MDCAKIKRMLDKPLFGNQIYCFDVIDSTNTHLLQMARDGAPEGTVVVADFQTSGRGRLSRQWLSPKNKNLLFSILLRPELTIDFVQKITLSVASALAESLENFYQKHKVNLSIQLKWPNDLLINGKKVAGILAESVLQDKTVKALVVGFGVNVNMEQGDVPQELQERVTSLKEETGVTVDREALLADFLSEFQDRYEKLERTSYDHVVDEWKERCRDFNRPIRIVTAEGEEEGIFYDLDEQGYLLYKTAQGEIKKLVAGEVNAVSH